MEDQLLIGPESVSHAVGLGIDSASIFASDAFCAPQQFPHALQVAQVHIRGILAPLGPIGRLERFMAPGSKRPSGESPHRQLARFGAFEDSVHYVHELKT